MATFEILLALVGFCVLLAMLALRLRLPVAVFMVVGPETHRALAEELDMEEQQIRSALGKDVDPT